MRMRAGVLSSLCAFAFSACLSKEAPTPEPSSHGLEIAVAPLALPGVGVACYDLAVTTAAGVVWVKGDPALTRLGHAQGDAPDATLPAATPADADTVCSDRFGNALTRGVTYIGTCDASPAADVSEAEGVQNVVTLWVDGLYNITRTAEIGAWVDPCPDGCSLIVNCDENADTKVSFNLTIMRAATQGFFDIAVNFENVFCSAKLDTCDASDLPIELLHGATADRDWTAVFGFACTAGTGDVETNLLYGNVAVVCGQKTFAIDPTAEEGTQTATSGGDTLHYGVYRGREQLSCDDPATEGVESCNKLYWNLAVSLDDLNAIDNASSGNSDTGDRCHLAFSATANDGDRGFANGLPTKTGVSYPYIEVDATLTPASCQRHQLNDGGAVNTVYHGTLGGQSAPVTMCSHYDGQSAGPVAGAACPGSTPIEGCPCWAEGTPGFEMVTYMESLMSGDFSVRGLIEDPPAFNYHAYQVINGVHAAVLVAGYAASSIATESGPGGFFCVAGREQGDEIEAAYALQPITEDQYGECLAEVDLLMDDRCQTGNGGCAGATPTCVYDGPGLHHCVGCRVDADCSEAQVCENTTCVACRDNAQCADTETCDPATHQCVPAVPEVPCAGDLGAWTDLTPLPTARSSFGLAQYNGWVYISGGDSGAGVLGDVHAAQIQGDGTLGPWVPAGTLGAARHGHTMVTYGDYLYVIGGNSTQTHDFAEVLVAHIDGSTVGPWTAATSLAAGRFFHTSVAYDGQMYAIGGYPFATAQMATIYPGGFLSPWTFTTPLSDGQRWVHTMAVFNGYLYVIGGDGGPHSNILMATMGGANGLGAWNPARSLPAPRGFHASTVASGYLYVLGGYGTDGVGTNDVFFAPFQDQGASLGAFHSATSRFSIPSYGHRSFASPGHIYVLGGNADGTSTGHVDRVQMSNVGTCTTP